MRFPNPTESRLILIGASSYEHEALVKLPAVDNCILDLRDILTAADIGGFLPENCLIPERNTRPQDLAQQIEEFSHEARDVLAIWFIGHGLFEVQSRKLHLALSGTDPGNLYWTALAFDLLRRAILTSPAKVKILMVDCCFSGRVIQEMAMGAPELLELAHEQIAVEGTYIMTACSGQDLAISPLGERYTAFTGCVIEAFRRAAPLPMSDLYRDVSRKLRGKDLPPPQQASSATAADLALVRPSPSRHSTGAAGVSFTFDPPDEPEAATRGLLDTDTLTYVPNHLQVPREGPEAGPYTTALAPPLSEEELNERMGSLYAAAEAVGGPGEESNPGSVGSRPEQVIAKLRQLITDMVQLGQPAHPLVLTARDLYAFWLGRAGLYVEAAHQCSRLVQAREELYGPEHADVLASRHNLAHMIGLTGKTGLAVSQFKLVFEDRKRLLGDHHADTLLSKRGLAYWNARNGDLPQSVEMHRELYSDDDFRLGPLDQQTLRSLSLLAWVQSLADDSAGARDSYRDLAGRWATLNGAGSPEALKFARFGDYWAERASDEA